MEGARFTAETAFSGGGRAEEDEGSISQGGVHSPVRALRNL
jgi:hypothetical protein